MKLVCVPLFVGACALLYYGSGMLLLVPGDLGESYLKSLFGGRFLYGVTPTLASAVLLVIVGWLWDRSNGSPDPLKTIGRSFAFAGGAIALFWIGLIIVADIRGGSG
ncbi:MAG TPA: hypothetical protein VGQ49_17020 [Bryobacteraceae bacterium]|jgi:hypothetical protein|nr:hypothetical protein [Bryobacteraceae bacterium]